MFNKKLIILILVITGLTATLCSCWKRYDTYINDKVVIPRLVSVNYNNKEGYQFIQAGYKCKFICDPTPPLKSITFYKLHVTEKDKPVTDLQTTLRVYFIEVKSPEPNSITSLVHQSEYPGWYKGMLNVKIGGVYKFNIICKNKQGTEVINRSFNIVIHNEPSAEDFRAYEKDRIAKEKKEYDRKKAIQKRKEDARVTKESKNQKGSITPAERYAAERYFAERERYLEQERYNAESSKGISKDKNSKKSSYRKSSK